MPKKLFIANRGEIAVRIAKTCRHLGILTVWPRCPEDIKPLCEKHVDFIVDLEAPGDYLDSQKIVSLAQKSNCEMIHPGYGYLSENIEFARRVREAGIVYLGPKEKALEVMGDKLSSRKAMEAAKVPIVPGTDAVVSAKDVAKKIKFPVLLKPSGGGGGKGMVVVQEPQKLEAALESCRRQAKKAFADDRIYIERWIERSRHIEVQILADSHGQAFAYGTRDCTVQRRYQKIIEECPAPNLSDTLRKEIEQAAVMAAQAVDYLGAGTVEFILTPENEFYFLEMNTRLQVEHPVTEMVYGLDLVQEQIRVALGEKLKPLGKPRGHAFEARIYAEDPFENFMPCIGKVGQLCLPQGVGVRVDSGITEGSEVGIHFDPLLLKVIAWGEDREMACSRLIGALKEFVLHGVGHNAPLILDVLNHKDFQNMSIDTRWLEEQNLNVFTGPESLHWLALAHAQNSATTPRVGKTSLVSLGSAFLEQDSFSFKGHL